MNVKFDDGDGLTVDPVPLEIRSSLEFQNAFLALRSEALGTLQKFPFKTLRYLAADQSILVKAKSLEEIMTVLAKYVSLVFCAI